MRGDGRLTKAKVEERAPAIVELGMVLDEPRVEERQAIRSGTPPDRPIDLQGVRTVTVKVLLAVGAVPVLGINFPRALKLPDSCSPSVSASGMVAEKTFD